MTSDFQLWSEKQVETYLKAGYWEPLSLGEHLHLWKNAFASHTALVEGEQRLTYAELDERTDRLASGLCDLGIQAGDRVLLQLPNRISFVVTLFALLRIGAAPILATPAHRQTDIAALCEVGEPVAYIIPDRFLGFNHVAMAEEIALKHQCIKQIIVDGEAGEHVAWSSIQGRPRAFPAPEPGSLAVLLLSGGTTGVPKLIPRSHADYSYNSKSSARLCGFDQNTVYLAALPVAHNFPLASPGLLGVLAHGGTVVLAQTPGFDECFDLIQRERVTVTALVPALAALWVEAREWDETDLSSLQLLQIGGARLEQTLAARIKAAFGCTLQQVFGTAEGLLCFTHPDDEDDIVFNTQGRPLSKGDEIRIVDDAGVEVPEGEIGELLVRGPYTIQGYYRAPEHNARSFTEDGFYRSGDRVRRTANGYLVVEGRIKEQINRSGEKIAAAEIEDHIRAHPAIKDVTVIAVPDARLGERSCAYVKSNDKELDLNGLNAFLRARGLPRYKLPDQLEQITSWPLTTIGKINKNVLVERALQRDQSEVSSEYVEMRIPFQSEPLSLACRLLAAGLSATTSLYEHAEEWSLGFDVAARVTLSAHTVILQDERGTRRWPVSHFSDAMDRALKEIPIEGWRAYGSAHFELARLFYDLPPMGAQEELLQLIVPRREVRLRNGEALIRALSVGEVQLMAALVQDLDEAPEMRVNGTVVDVPIRSVRPHDYKTKVAEAVKEIRSGLYDKVIISRQIPIPETIDMVASYQAGRQRNTPARSFVFTRPEFSVAGFSPETVVEVSASGWVSTQPLAGTRALGKDKKEEESKRNELITDAKEIAEHVISVKLAFEELKTVCDAESIVLREFMGVCRRGTVQHLGSRLCAQLQDKYSPWRAFQALFPAVTASGIPKREAIDAIERHEQKPRGLYSGAVMVVDSDGFLDAALVLRSFYQQGQQQWIQAGAGLVADSTPERELEETCEKLSSVSLSLIPRQHDRATVENRSCVEVS